MSGTAAALAIGSLAAKWVFKLWVSDSAADVSADMGSLAEKFLPGAWEARRTRRQFEHLGEAIAQRISPMIEIEYAGIPAEERAAAINAVDITLQRSDLDVAALLRRRLDAELVERAVREADPSRPDRDWLGAPATELYNTLLREVCRYVTELATGLPGFQSAATVAMLEHDNDIFDLANSILSRMPKPRVPAEWGVGSEDDRFESRYLQAVVDRLDVLELYGAGLSESKKRYPLSVAYISLSASGLEREHSKATPTVTGESEFGLALEGVHNADGLDGTTIGDEEFLRVERALNGAPRVLVAGQAGSGKTTLLQWLAVSAARREMTGELESWNGHIPFFIRLRQFSDTTFPAPEDFVKALAPNLAAVMPDGWAHRALAEERALVLIDGVDELSEARRTAAREWLRNLLVDYPSLQVVVTSRTTALSRDWQELEGFRSVQLQPMDLGDMRAMISHWHRAARAVAINPAAIDRLQITENDMLSAVRENAAIRGLSTNPLLCALICALHRDNSNRLPESRMELYATALKTLLVSRDEERNIDLGRRSGLSYEARKALIRDFAVWLLDNNASDATTSVFERHVSRALKQLTHVQVDSQIVVDELLERSGVMRIPVEGRVDFIHRTFLEYLAAEALIDDGSVGKIVEQAHRDQWREVVVLACGHASFSVREELLRSLIARGKNEDRYLHRLYLLAVSCLETSVRLSPELRSNLDTCLEAVMPPKNMTEATAVASAGNSAVPQLLLHRTLATQAAACVRSLSLIGSEEALVALATFSSDSRVTVSRQLIRAWTQFDPERFSREVLGQSPLDRGHLIITDPALLPLLGNLHKLMSYFVDCPGRLESLQLLQGDSRLMGVDLSFSSWVTALEFPGNSQLRTVICRNSPNLVSLKGLAEAPLRYLDLGGCESLQDLRGLPLSRSYRRLSLVGTGPSNLQQLSGVDAEGLYLSGMHALEQLSVVDAKVDHLVLGNCPQLNSIDDLQQWKRLRSLRLHGTFGSGMDLRIPDTVESLTITPMDQHLIDNMALPRGLRELSVLGSYSDALESQLAGLSELESLSLGSPANPEIVKALAEQASLRTVYLWQGVRGVEDFALEGFTPTSSSGPMLGFTRD